MTTLVIGDVHNKWRSMEKIVEFGVRSCEPESVVFIGDIVNDWHSSAFDEIDSTNAWMDWVLRTRMDREVKVCVGNHDIPYLSTMRAFGCPGYNADAASSVRDIFLNVGMSVAFHERIGERDFVFSHAGLTNSFVSTLMGPGTEKSIVDVVNAANNAFDARGIIDPVLSRDDGPLWVRPKELLSDTWGSMFQVIGHTPVPCLTARQGTGGTVLMCDTFSTDSYGIALGDTSLLILG